MNSGFSTGAARGFTRVAAKSLARCHTGRRTSRRHEAEVQRLARHARPEVADAIRFAALTGLRRSELLSLKPEQVQDGLIALTAHTKSGRPRGIPIPPEASRIASRRLPWAVSPHALWEGFKAAREAAGLSHVRFHDLRHTYASWIVQDGKPLTAVRDLLGHSSLAVTNRYAHLAPAHLVDAVSGLPRLGKMRGKPYCLRSRSIRSISALSCRPVALQRAAFSSWTRRSSAGSAATASPEDPPGSPKRGFPSEPVQAAS